jgi:hypothetical protein
LPAETGIVNDLKNANSTILLSEPFFPPQDIYTNKDMYNKYLIKLALIGDFDKVELKVSGVINNDLKNFISININNVSGILGGYRSGINTLDLDKTTGVFDKNNPINFTLNLKEPTKLSTTQNEFSSSFMPTKNVIIWDQIKPSVYTGQGTIANFLIAPYSENGKYGDNVSINKIEFVYTCKGEKNSCKATLCDKNKNYIHGSECLRDNFEKDFGKESWIKYSEYFNK